MNKHLFFLLTLALSFNCYAQISYEKGYFIENNGKKVECFIENVDWKNNPTEFKYKLSESSESIKVGIATVKEFSVQNYSKYVRANVKIDRSSSNINQLSSTRNPIFKEETLFLKILVEGTSNLYYYEDGNLIRYFYGKDGHHNIEQLIFKYYLKDNNIRGENNSFRQQLLNNLECTAITPKGIEKTKYSNENLIRLFILYNQCMGSESVNYQEMQKRTLFNLNIRPGLNVSSLNVTNQVNTFRNVDFGNKLGFRFGVEGEFFLPFNKSKWSIIVEPTYQQFKAEQESPNSMVDYKSIEIPLGIRHYFFLSESSKLFINGSYVLDNVLDSKISYSSADVEITKSTNLGFGFGYKKNDKYSLELRYHTSRNLLSSFAFYDSDFNTLSMIFGYSLF
ncbi:outer membrane beta-barrel protein [Flagellimonas flava]|uniref:outer membrane beta-barrel protein n=1 Tax=Flagellimonas flava TaxID=570519 RepID=UPI003D658AC8